VLTGVGGSASNGGRRSVREGVLDVAVSDTGGLQLGSVASAAAQTAPWAMFTRDRGYPLICVLMGVMTTVTILSGLERRRRGAGAKSSPGEFSWSDLLQCASMAVGFSMPRTSTHAEGGEGNGRSLASVAGCA
jgi:hypothetical protein